MAYSGPPVCRRKSTWDSAPYCDGCGAVVPDFTVWRANARYCSPDCRPEWHLVSGRECQGLECEERVLVGSGRGRPRSYCSVECRETAKAEDKRRRRGGGMTRLEEMRFMELLFGESSWLRAPAWVADDWGSLVRERVEQVRGPGDAVGSLDRWLSGGGDWPGMVPGVSKPVAEKPTLGLWEPTAPSL